MEKKDKHLKIPESGAANRLKGKLTDEQKQQKDNDKDFTDNHQNIFEWQWQ